MECQIIDGKALAATIREEIRLDVLKFRKKHQWPGIAGPRLGAIIVGGDPASKLYVERKVDACVEVGLGSCVVNIPPNKDDLLAQIDDMNNDPEIAGYILQLPLPKPLNPIDFFDRISPLKDIDVFHPENVGLLVQGRPRFKPCTPHGIQVMLSRNKIPISGKHVVVINRSDVVGKPLSSMLIQDNDEFANATVTVCHNKTPKKYLVEMTKTADIVVVAVGIPGFLTKDMLKPGCVVVDVGITRVGKKIFGDADANVREVAGWITPVPGGVGPMTVTMLVENTLRAARLRLKY